MSGNVKIPVVKNRISPKQRAKRKRGLLRLGVIGCALVVMLLVVWLHVQTNQLLADIQNLEAELIRYRNENNKLYAQVAELSDFSRIYEIARNQLKLDFLDHEKVIEVPAE